MHGLCSISMTLGRILLSLFFLWDGYHRLTNLEESIHMLDSLHLPMANVVMGVAAVLEFIGGLSLLLGYKARFGAILLLIVLIPATILLHDFWAKEGVEASISQLQFLKNLGIIGGLLYVASCGPGWCAFGCSSSCGTSCHTQK